MNNETPLWNLDSIFKSINDKEYLDAVKNYDIGMNDLLNRCKNVDSDFENWLKDYLIKEDEVLGLGQTLNAYSYIIYSVDTTNTSFLNNISTIDEMGLKMTEVDLKFKKVLVQNKDKLDSFYKKYPQFEEYRFILNERIEETAHEMSEAEENLAGDLQRTGGDAWDRLHEQIISNLKDETGKTFNGLRNDAYDPDPKVRKSAWKKEIELLKTHRIAFAACLNNLKGETVTLNKRRNWKKALDRSLAASRLSESTLNAMVSAIEDSFGEFRKYFKAKAKYLKKHNLTASDSAKEGLAFYDLFAPLGDGCGEGILSKKWTFNQAKDYVIERYDSFSSDMGNFARQAFDENWVDAVVREGKVGGAYDEDFAKGHQSRIMVNFTGAFSDIITLAHEAGHAYHFSCLKGKPSVFFSYPMTLAETASTFAETIVKQDMISKCKGEEKLQIIEMDLQDVSQVLVDILCRFYFEKAVFEKRGEGELNADDFCQLMSDAQEKSYGDGLNDERHEYMWAVKSHYYSTGFDFYNFPYAFGQLFAAGLYSRYLREGKSFAATYAEILSNTGSMSCEDLCKKAGCDITQPAFWKSGIEMYLKEIRQFLELTETGDL